MISLREVVEQQCGTSVTSVQLWIFVFSSFFSLCFWPMLLSHGLLHCFFMSWISTLYSYFLFVFVLLFCFNCRPGTARKVCICSCLFRGVCSFKMFWRPLEKASHHPCCILLTSSYPTSPKLFLYASSGTVSTSKKTSAHDQARNARSARSALEVCWRCMNRSAKDLDFGKAGAVLAVPPLWSRKVGRSVGLGACHVKNRKQPSCWTMSLEPHVAVGYKLLHYTTYHSYHNYQSHINSLLTV